MAQSDATVRVRVLDGTWETFGVDRSRGVWPESLQYAHDKWGSASASFDLRRDPGALWPDLAAASQVEVEIGGVLVWSGRVKETPMRDGSDRVVNVQCEGWQYHLDDDVYERVYVHTKMGEWRDTRGFLECDLATHTAGGQITADGGLVQVTWPQNSQLRLGDNRVGVTLDLGLEEHSWASRVVVEVESSNNAGTIILFCRGTSIGATHDPSGNADAFNAALTTIGAGPSFLAGTLPSTKRYLHLFLFHNAGAAGPAGADYWIRFRRIMVFSSPDFESGNTSILKASSVILDAKARATIMVSSDNSQVETDTFNIPEFATGGLKTPREAINAVNAYEDKICQVDVHRRLVYKERPTAPELEIGAWSGADFEDSSANSLGDVSNKVMMEGQGPDGSPLRVLRTAGQQSIAQLEAVSSPAPTNPSFDTNTTGWTIVSGTGTITRNTGVFHTSPASGLLTNNSADRLQATFTGTFVQGKTYVVTFHVRSVAAAGALIWARFGSGLDAGWLIQEVTALFAPIQIVWTPSASAANVVLLVQPYQPSGGDIYIDTVQLFVSTPTIIDRQGFIRAKVLPLRTAQTSTSAAKLGDTWLGSHRTVPFRGGGRAQIGGVRRILGGENLHPSQLGLHTGRLLRLSHRTDPDTGGHGRDGVLASVGYDHSTQTAQFSLDDDRANYEALMERLAVVQGQFGQ